MNEMKQNQLAIGYGGEARTQTASFVPRPPASANNLPTVVLFTHLTEMDNQCWVGLEDDESIPSLFDKLSELELPAPLLKQWGDEANISQPVIQLCYLALFLQSHLRHCLLLVTS